MRVVTEKLFVRNLEFALTFVVFPAPVWSSDKVLKPDAPLALRAQAVLLFGLSVLLQKKTTIYLRECDDLKNQIIGFDLAQSDDVTVSKNKRSTRCESTRSTNGDKVAHTDHLTLV